MLTPTHRDRNQIIMILNELEVGKTAVVTNVGGSGALRQHFLDMGILPGARWNCASTAMS